MAYKVGIDVGGTFTDFLLVDEKGNFNLFKTLSTPKDPSIGVTNGLEEMARFLEKSLEAFLSELRMPCLLETAQKPRLSRPKASETCSICAEVCVTDSTTDGTILRLLS